MSNTQSPVMVSLEFTPNPNTLKYVVNRQLIKSGAANFPNAQEAEKSPLAKKLFTIPGMDGVMIGRDFVTITKGSGGDWEALNRLSTETIKTHLTNNETIVDEAFLNAAPLSGGTSEIEDKIRKILDEQIRPAVAMDGGDITLERFEDGVVYVYLQGSCSGCPSSTATLKMGIETRLKEAIPEVREVVSI